MERDASSRRFWEVAPRLKAIRGHIALQLRKVSRVQHFVRNGRPVGKLEGYSAQLVVDEAIGWIGRRDRAKPFFLYVCFHEPHEPIATDPSGLPVYLSEIWPDEREIQSTLLSSRISFTAFGICKTTRMIQLIPRRCPYLVRRRIAVTRRPKMP